MLPNENETSPSKIEILEGEVDALKKKLATLEAELAKSMHPDYLKNGVGTNLMSHGFKACAEVAFIPKTDK